MRHCKRQIALRRLSTRYKDFKQPKQGIPPALLKLSENDRDPQKRPELRRDPVNSRKLERSSFEALEAKRLQKGRDAVTRASNLSS